MGAVNGGAQLLIDSAETLAKNDGVLGINHWLKAICTRNAGLLESLALNVDAKQLLKEVDLELQQNKPGRELPVASVVERALAQARNEGKEKATERNIIRIVLQEANFVLQPDSGNAWRNPGEESHKQSNPKSTARKTPTLDKYGVDLTKAARKNKFSRLLGRETELNLVMETLCRRTKRNPVLVGPAGVGKTAIVEGLAQLIVSGQVPEILKDRRVIALQPSNLIAGASYGELEGRMKDVLYEAAQPGIILFIDEVHSIIGAGGSAGINDMASLLKPALSRGEISCIAATTDDEYRRFIETDTALERRFQPIRVQEMTREQAEQVLLSLREELCRLHPVKVSDDVICRLTYLAQQYLRNRYFPDKAVDLLEQCVAHAAVNQKDEVDYDDAEEIVFRMIGMPLNLDQRLESLGRELAQSGWLSSDQIENLTNRLSVTLRGLDLHNNRPNAVILLVGEAAEHCDDLARLIASCLYGAEQRVVAVELSHMVHPSDTSMLIGSPPGYVGFAERTPLHSLNQMPWSVICWKNIDNCHSVVFELIKQGLLQGSLVDARGKKIYFSDTVVIISAAQPAREMATSAIGFRSQTSAAAEASTAEEILGVDLGRMVDIVCSQSAGENEGLLQWLRSGLLVEVGLRFKEHGMKVTWDDSIVEWLAEQANSMPNECEKIIDNVVSPAILKQIRQQQNWQDKTLIVKYLESQICLESLESC